MELTIDQALQKGIEAHKAGKVQEADRLYTAILKAQPKHPDANHNMGVLAVGLGQVKEALPFFKTALEADPNINQFWLSYVDALIKLDQMDEAKTVLDQVKEKGAKGVHFDKLKKRLEEFESFSKECDENNSNENFKDLKPLPHSENERFNQTAAVNKFYHNQINRIVSDASSGWFYAASFDTYFLETIIPKFEVNHKGNKIPNNLASKSLNLDYDLDGPRNIINFLNEKKNILEKMNILKQLVSSNDKLLIHDSFHNKTQFCLIEAQKEVFDRNSLNIVIIGAGICGLFLANCLKCRIGEYANVLLVDNRSKFKHCREPFTREWLTNIPTHTLIKNTAPNIESLFGCFGVNGFVGLPINLIESILMLSCKDIGVKFYFDRNINYSMISDNDINFLFDATGGRLDHAQYETKNVNKIKLIIPNHNRNYQFSGVNQICNTKNSDNGKLQISLKPSRGLHQPYINESQIYTPLVKLVDIPLNLKGSLLEHIKPFNSTNLIYIWTGTLKDEINSCLVIINLTYQEYKFLTLHLNNPTKLTLFLKTAPKINKKLNKNLLSFLKFLKIKDCRNEIKIEKPFIYQPWINLNPLSSSLNGKPIYPVGDSLFCGHPKVGNGLGMHLPFINDLVDQMATEFKALW